MNEEIDFDSLMKQNFEALKLNTEILTKEFGKTMRQRPLWIAQIITISGVILGGFSIANFNHNIYSMIGLPLLFITISFGLIMNCRENNSNLDTLRKAFGKSFDFSFRYGAYLELIKKDDLTEEEQTLKNELEKSIKGYLQEMGAIKENGSLGSVSEKIFEYNPRFDWNYALIVGFLISVLLLVFANF